MGRAVAGIAEGVGALLPPPQAPTRPRVGEEGPWPRGADARRPGRRRSLWAAEPLRGGGTCGEQAAGSWARAGGA